MPLAFGCYFLQLRPSWVSRLALLRYWNHRSFRQAQQVRYSHCYENKWLASNLVCGSQHYNHQGLFMAKPSHELDMDCSLRLQNSIPDQGCGIARHTFVCGTELLSPVMASNVQDAEAAVFGNVEMKINMGTSWVDHIVYKRRPKKTMAVEKVSTVIETLQSKSTEPESVACVVQSEGQTGEATAVPQKSSQSQKRSVIKRIDARSRNKKTEVFAEAPRKSNGGGKRKETKMISASSGKKDEASAEAPHKSRSKVEAPAEGPHKSGPDRKRKVTKKIYLSEDLESAAAPSSRRKKVASKTVNETASRFQGRNESPETCQTEAFMDQKGVVNAGLISSEACEIEERSIEMLNAKGMPWLVLSHKKVQSDWRVYNPLTMRCLEHKGSSVKILSWNVNGLRALLKGKGDQLPGTSISRLAEKEDFDVLCLQETKLQEKDVLAIKETLLPAYGDSLWSCSIAKLGYSGTAVISRIKPLSISYGLGISKHDTEGRIITLEFKTFFLVTCYVPNSGQKLERLAYRTQDWDLSLGVFLKELEKRKPVILTGDLNCAHQEIDIYNPDGNRRSAGFTDEERASFEKNFLNNGFHDTFRRLHPNVVGYTYWGYRTAARPKNHGWRLDYYLVSDALSDMVRDSYILPDVEGSDHCPVGLILEV